jgi:hypothetical protein
LGREEDAAKEVDHIAQLSPQDPTVKLAAAITSGRLQLRAGKLEAGTKALASVVADARKLGVPRLQFEARLAQAEIALFGGDKRASLSALSSLQKDASKKGFKQIQARAKGVAQQINMSKAG